MGPLISQRKNTDRAEKRIWPSGFNGAADFSAEEQHLS